MSPSQKLHAAILGASGYIGSETVRLLVRHPGVTITCLAGERSAGLSAAEVLPHTFPVALPQLVAVDDVSFDDIDVVFCALPHATTQKVVLRVPTSAKVIDASADFRLDDLDTYEKWYGTAHIAPELQKEAIYALTEFSREEIKGKRIISCPGCYPTSALLPLVPLVEAHLIDPTRITIDAKSGVSGAGRGEKQANLHAEVSEGIHAYGVGHHRHMPEIDQALSRAAGQHVEVTFTPHLMPMNRGILSTIYVHHEGSQSSERLHQELAARFAGEEFVHVLPFGATPATRHVRGSNYALVGVSADRQTGRSILTCALDNLVKGAAGQMVQNFNVAFGFDETLGIDQLPLFP